ncbi:hypothetical protein [Anoxybacteroides tepidamans]|uniref:hypothetical protein n=1 Tax=Anoxybacteroides tepidamans TaxID=265948 RepID=UPI0012EC130D|nr:hypothetical protein [Anoxybacillus tepidamans]
MSDGIMETLVNYMIKQIEDEKEVIREQTERVIFLTDSIVKSLEDIKDRNNAIREKDIISDYNFMLLQNKLQSLINALQEINFSKRRIRKYHDEMCKLNTFLEDGE